MSVHTHTPQLSAIDPLGHAVRSIAYCRHSVDQSAQTRISRHCYDTGNQAHRRWDPRLWAASGAPNLITSFSLAQRSLLTESVDAGWQLELLGPAGETVLAWDSRGNVRKADYDALQRPMAITEHAPDESPGVTERFTYATSDSIHRSRNQCGRLIRHDDPAGSLALTHYGLLASTLSETRRFLVSLSSPNWPLEEAERDRLLESDDGFSTQTQVNALGKNTARTDAMGNRHIWHHTLTGDLRDSSVKLAGIARENLLIRAISYTAAGNVEQETLGNGMSTVNRYAENSGELMRVTARREGARLLQDVHYEYDPCGNILHIEDEAVPVRHFNNQRITAVNGYGYDSLYQLIEATGRELAGGPHEPGMPAFQSLPLDPNRLAHYTQHFSYDSSGNLINRQHSNAPALHMASSRFSNRSLAALGGPLPDEATIAAGFDARGNIKELLRGQALQWNLRNQLASITLIKRRDGADDRECYRYDGQGLRLRKVNITQTPRGELTNEVRYLPGIELYWKETTGELRQVISAGSVNTRVRVLHWDEQPPDGIANEQIRYSLNDHLGSSTLELDAHANLISQEWYYPFGGTALWAGRNELQARYKTIRYSGQTRDASGLYCYQQRYYAPFWQRWINPDPAGDTGGLNLYQMVFNNPVNLIDDLGLMPKRVMRPSVTPSTLTEARTKPALPISSRHSATKSSSESPPLIPGSTFSPGLSERLNTLDESTQQRLRYVETNMQHRINEWERGGIYSTADEFDDQFENIYTPQKWTFELNFKRSNTHKYYASNVTLVQYRTVAQRENFMGYLPSVIIRKNVINETTLELTEQLKSSSEEMRDIFLTQTPNGKTTQRVLDDFGLVATQVERAFLDGQYGGPSFLIHVVPAGAEITGDKGAQHARRRPVNSSLNQPESPSRTRRETAPSTNSRRRWFCF